MSRSTFTHLKTARAYRRGIERAKEKIMSSHLRRADKAKCLRKRFLRLGFTAKFEEFREIYKTFFDQKG